MRLPAVPRLVNLRECRIQQQLRELVLAKVPETETSFCPFLVTVKPTRSAPQQYRSGRASKRLRRLRGFDRVSTSLGVRGPADLRSAGVNETLLEAVIYRFLINVGEAEGREIADQVKLPFTMIEGLLARLKMSSMLPTRTTATHDYVHVLTETGRKVARSHLRDSVLWCRPAS